MGTRLEVAPVEAAGAAEGGTAAASTGGSLDVDVDVAAGVVGADSAAGFGLGCDDHENLGRWVKEGESTLVVMRTKKSFSFTLHDPIVLSSGRILPSSANKAGYENKCARNVPE